jgi:hypothetical protein
MHPWYVPIDADLLKRLYIDERLTAETIARQISCAPITILRRLRRFNIPTRPRGPLHQAKTLNGHISWSANLAWAVGLIATDGNLSGDARHMTVTSIDRDLLETLRERLNLSVAITPNHGGSGRSGLRVQWGDRHFYEWLVGIGLTPAKSLTLGPLAVPDEHFVHFLRGCVDGDGSITTYVDRYNTFKKPTYVYTRLFVSIVSASPRFLDWLQATVSRLAGLSGSLTVRRSASRNDIWCLKYAKRESLTLLRWMYKEHDAPCLRRKRNIAAKFLVPLDPSPRRSPGRPMVI